MNEPRTPTGGRLLVAIEVSPALSAPERGEPSLHALVEEFGERLKRLGIDWRPEFELRAGDAIRTVRVRVHDRLQRFSPDLMERAWSMVAPPELADLPRQPAVPSPDGFPDGWFRAFLEGLAADDEARQAVAVRFVGWLAVETVLDQPECLLGPEQLETLGRNIPRHPWRSDTEVRALFHGLLRVGPLPPLAAIEQALLEGQEYGDSIENTIEGLVAAHRDDRMEIHLSRGDLRAIAPSHVDPNPLSAYAPEVIETARGAFEQMEKTLFSELGVRIPDPVLREEPKMPAGMLRLWVSGRLSPPLSFRSSSWPEAVGIELRRRPGLLLCVEDVEHYLAFLEGTFPELVWATMERLPLGDLTRVLRGLLEEGVSIIDLRAILERLLQFDTIPIDAGRYLVLDDRLPLPPSRAQGREAIWQLLLKFVRSGSGVRNWMTKQLGSGQLVAKKVRVIRIAEELEQEALRTEVGEPGDGLAAERTQEALVSAVWVALASVPSDSGRTPLLIRDPSARAPVRHLLAGEFPDLPIIVLSELRPDVRIVSAFPEDEERGEASESDISIVEEEAMVTSGTPRVFRRVHPKAPR